MVCVSRVRPFLVSALTLQNRTGNLALPYVNTVQEQHMKMDIQIQCTAETLN